MKIEDIHLETNDLRTFKTVKTRIGFALPVGLVMAFTCGGWLPLVEPNARHWSYLAAIVFYWLDCAAMIFLVSWLIDRPLKPPEARAEFLKKKA